MERNKAIPTLGERVAQAVAQLREQHGTDQGGLAAALTSLGCETSTSTITRIETGRQLPTINELLALALLSPTGGLRGLLQTPFRIGDIAISDDADWLTLISGGLAQANQDATDRYMPALRDRRDRLIAADIGTDAAAVRDAGIQLYGVQAQAEISRRASYRASEDVGQPTSSAKRAYRSHAVRNVVKEIRHYLKEQS